MRIVSFNINGIRARLHQLAAVRERLDPDVIALQETKVQDDEFPIDAVRDLGYHACWHGQKGHYGVAVLSKQPPAEVVRGLPGDGEDAQRRLLTVRFDTAAGAVEVLDGYFPQGENRSHPVKFPAKCKFYADLRDYLASRFAPTDAVVLLGDMNVAPLDLDIGIGADNAKRWLRTGACCFLPEEREWLQALTSWGLKDSYRVVHPEVADRFSWFDYRSKGFEREPKRGLRIDLLLATAPLAARVTAAGIDYDIRAMERPSDHCPVWADFALG
jgi:exodeoxyribonuclease-3